MESQHPLFLIEVHNVLPQFWKYVQKGLGSKVNLSTAFYTQTYGQAYHTIQT